MGIVVYNPQSTLVRTAEGQVDGKSWKYIEALASVERHLVTGRLVEANAPEDMETVSPEARDAFEELRTAPKPRRASSARKSNPGDTEVSKDSINTEQEA